MICVGLRRWRSISGHATLGSSFVVFNELEPDRQSVAFHTRAACCAWSAGELLEMAFPVRRPERVLWTPAPLLIEALGVNPWKHGCTATCWYW
ncbi:MAG: hypothetical protein ACLSAH_14310 [Bilophila wadsworthia]